MITPELVVAFPAFFEPKESLDGKMKYGGCFLIAKDDKSNLELLEKEIDKAIEYGIKKKWNGKRPKFKNEPLRDGDEYLEEFPINKGEDPDAATVKMYEGRLFFNASSNEDNPPGIVGPNGAPLTDKTAIYSGAIVRLDIRAFPYSFSGNHGVSWWLNNVMLVRDGERLDGKLNAVDAFAQYAQPEETPEQDNADTGSLA